MFFPGQSSAKRKVDLRGRSRQEASRQELLDKARNEREQRKQYKEQTRAATVIQAAWRAHVTQRQVRSAVRQEWISRYGSHGELAVSSDLRPSSSFLGGLVLFADVSDKDDIVRLAAACRLGLSSRNEATGRLEVCSLHPPGGAAVAVHRAQRLARLCLEALTHHREALRHQLARPRQAVSSQACSPDPSSAAAPDAAVVGPLVDILIRLTGPEDWGETPGSSSGGVGDGGSGSGGGACGPAASVTLHLARHSLVPCLSLLVSAACPPPGGDAMSSYLLPSSPPSANGVAGGGRSGVVQQQQRQQQQQGPGQGAVSAAESLATALQVRALKVSQGRPDVELQLPLLLCVPLLWARCHTLAAAAPHLVPRAVHSLQRMGCHGLAAWLPPNLPGGKAAAAAALYGNLAEVMAAVLAAQQQQPATAAGPMAPQLSGDSAAGGGGGGAAAANTAVQFARLAHYLLSIMPLADVFGGGRGDAAQEEDDDLAPSTSGGVAGASSSSSSSQHPPPAQQLPWAGPPPGPYWRQQLQSLAVAPTLRALTCAVLPAANAAAAPSKAGPEEASSVRALCLLLDRLLRVQRQGQRVLISLAVGSQLVQRLWYSYLRAAQASGGAAWQMAEDGTADPGWMVPLSLLARAYGCFMISAGEDEIYVQQVPLPLAELYDASAPHRGLVALLKWALWQALWTETPPVPGGWGPSAVQLRRGMQASVGRLLGKLYDLNCRRPFAPTEAFHAEQLPAGRFHAEMQASPHGLGSLASATVTKGGAAGTSSRAWQLLRYAPYMVPFTERALVFQAAVAADRQSQLDYEGFGGGGPNAFTVVRRDHLLEDGFRHLNVLGEALKSRVRIQFVNSYGMEEAGVDGGGIFKEFLQATVRDGFNPNLGLFKATSDNCLYPNPLAAAAVPGALEYLGFLGRMLGKALYEGILLELPLAGFFLKKFRGTHCDLHDLPSLDPELYNSLLYLKELYRRKGGSTGGAGRGGGGEEGEGDVSDLGLSFTIVDEIAEGHVEVELVPGGRDMAVTNDNVVAYIHHVANHRLNRQIQAGSAAFLRGLHDLVPPAWTAMFNEHELQTLISRAQDALDLNDMAAHVQYSGGYHQQHPVIVEFWAALRSMTSEQQRGFLKFVTSCSRPPLLGFRYLEPQLCVQMAGSMLDASCTDRLPTAATCMNLLKLPPYRSADVTREKLLYAMSEGTGFELS